MINAEQMQEALALASPSEKIELLRLVEEIEKRKVRDEAQDDFLSFVRSQWPDFISGAHHRRIAKLFEDVAAGKKKRIIINLAPRHTKSEFASFLFPAWFLGKNPKKKVMQVSNTGELAEGFGRKVRNLFETEEYRAIFPDVELRADSKAAGRWNTNHGGDYYATGVGAALAGRGADLCIIDDPHTESEAVSAVFNPGIYDKVYEWFTTGPRQRLQPGGAIIIVQCMAGDTLVLRPDGSEIALRHLRVGDEVATYVAGAVGVSTITNFRSNGVDSIHKIQTQSGRILRANERHPFLVEFNGERKWARLKDLTPGMQLVSLRAAADLHGQKQNPESAAHAKQTTHTTEKTQTRRDERSDTTARTKARHALKKVVASLYTAITCAITTIQNNTGHQEKEGQTRKHGTSAESKRAMDSLLKNTKRCLKFRTDDVLSVESYPEATSELIGEESSVSTIVTTQEKSEGSCVTTAISRLDMEEHQKYLKEPWHTSDFITDQIEAITPDGEEEVFDIEVAHTENFIAEGVVSHNTRWSLRDLTGQIIDHAAKHAKSDQWEVFEFPAILPSGNPLWPEFWSIQELEAIKSEIPAGKWNAQYQQNPTSDETAIIKRADWQIWDKPKPPPIDYIILAMDTAFEAKKSADYSAAVVFGVWTNDEDGGQPNLMLLEAWRDKLEFPELKAKAKELYKEWEPDSVIIEKKASGAPLIYELRRMGIPVQEYTPSRGNDKITRLNAIADIFASGKVWAPDRRWADELIEEVASFPAGRYDDFVDCTSLALARFRAGGFIGTQNDMSDEEYQSGFYRRKAAYY